MIKNKEYIVDSIDYRGQHLDFYNDDAGQQVYTYLPWNPKENECIGFGSYNTQYKEDAQHLVDQYLDTIWEYGNDSLDLWGGKLEFFFNGGYRDIKLTYRRRTLKLFLLPPSKTVEEDNIPATLLVKKIKPLISEGRQILKKYLQNK